MKIKNLTANDLLVLNSLTDKFYTPVKNLRIKTGMSAKSIRESTLKLLEHGYPIISSTTFAKGAHGIKIADNEKEVEFSAKQLQSHANGEMLRYFFLMNSKGYFKAK